MYFLYYPGYLELCCCLSDFDNPSIMDIKMGLITFSHLEASLLKQRSDLYERMVCEDPLSTSQEENKNKSVTKLRSVSSVRYAEDSKMSGGT